MLGMQEGCAGRARAIVVSLWSGRDPQAARIRSIYLAARIRSIGPDGARVYDTVGRVAARRALHARARTPPAGSRRVDGGACA